MDDGRSGKFAKNSEHTGQKPGAPARRTTTPAHLAVERAVFKLHQAAGNKAAGQLLRSLSEGAGVDKGHRVSVDPRPRARWGYIPSTDTPAIGDSGSTGSHLGRVTYRSPVKQADETYTGWNSLQTDFERINAKLMRQNAKRDLVGTRSHILDKLQRLWSKIGAPRAVDVSMFQLRAELDSFKADLRKESARAQDLWPQIEQLHRDERERLAGIPGRFNKLAVKYLDSQYGYSWNRAAAAAPDMILDDIRGVQTVITEGSYLARAKRDAAAQILKDTKKGRKRGQISTWPWPEFKASQLIAEGGEHGMHQAMHMLDSAVEHQIGNAAKNMLEAGVPAQDVRAWTEAVRRDVARKLMSVDRAVANSLRHGHKLVARLKLFAYATVVLDIGISTLDVRAAPPGKRLRLAAYHTGRIAGGFAGATGGGVAGAKLGSRFGIAGGIVGGLVGATLGGLVGAWVGKKTLVYIHDKVWPPDGTSVEVKRR